MDFVSSGSADSHVIRYRPDIDGLRGIAVLSVVFFHLTRAALPGGYLGVDIFFLLSGYLITSIIWHQVQVGSFSIVRFYDRRIRRIMPALLLLLFLTTVASIVFLLPADLIGYSKSLLTTLTFVANIYFWRDTNYFARAAEDKPLLHLWSLGVEEQFYILFPLILALLARWWPSGALPTIVALTLGSLAANVVALFVGAVSPAFFLLPARAWELGLGSFLALLPVRAAPRAATASLGAAFGALLVVISMVCPLKMFPLMPVGGPAVVGSALVILAGQHESSAVTRALSFSPLVFVGLISYSLYLWHWPIIVFGRYYLVREFTLLEIAAALGLMTACAIGSWHFIERPFRSKKMRIEIVRGSAISGVIALAVAAAALLWSQGLPRRLSVEAAAINAAVGTNYRCPPSDYIAFGISRACSMNLPSRDPADADVVLLGNSHAQMYAPAWASILAERGQTGLLVPANMCLPTVQINASRDCNDLARRNLMKVENLARTRTVIIALTWWFEAGDLVDPSGRPVDNRDNSALISALDDLINQLQRARKHVVLIGPIAQPNWDVASVISRQIAFGRPVDRAIFLPAADFDRRFDIAIRHFEARRDIGFARPDRVQCRAERCYYLLDGHSLFADADHIAVGELPRFRALFAAALPRQTARQR